ncbi:MAG: thioredoxin fold domain-containing protein [Bdellovibrionaceae bacterium]|jgi:thioredoxin:protein disulfide reductase|nr:thioredoxin fold domain-containing protein [Pseudobdellovibrionaceae bacterium]
MKLILNLCLSFFCFSQIMANAVINENPLSASFIGEKDSFHVGENTSLVFQLDLAPKHQAYAEKFKISSPTHPNIALGDPEIDPIIEFMDVFSKKIKKGIEGKATLTTRFEFPVDMKTGTQKFIFKIQYQACTKDYCLLPIKVPVEVNLNILPEAELKAPFDANGTTGTIVSNAIPLPETKLTLEQRIHKMGLLAVFLFVFMAGLLTSFTPCIYPMIPITMAILGNKAHERNKTKNFLLSSVYVLGIATTYAVLGLVAAKTGALFGGFLGHPAAVAVICIIFITMGLSMFGLFELQPPAFIQKKLNPDSKSKGYKNAYLAGMAAGILASPCVGPVLVGILTYVAKTQNMTLGFFLLFTFALGFGLLFLVLGTFSHLASKLPKSGAWMNIVKYIFGTVMFFMAFYYAYPLIKRYIPSNTTQQVQSKNHSDWQNYSEKLYEKAKADGKNIIIDFWADWCAACIELEEKTFTNPKVIQLLKDKDVVLFKFDATLQDGDFQNLKEKYGIIGLPNLIFYDSNGKIRRDLTLTGFESEEDFIQRINMLK